jgi:hypothetical protein
MASSGFSVFASGLIVIVSANGRLAPQSAQIRLPRKGDNDHGYILPRQYGAAGSARAG